MADSLDMDLEFTGDAKLNTMLGGLSLDMVDLKSATEEVGRGAVKTFSGRVFTSRGQFIRQPWPRLSADYAGRKAKNYRGRPVLVRTGQMQDGFQFEATRTSATIHNPTPHFAYHQSSAPRSKIPRRAMIGIYQGLDSDVRETVAAVLARKIGERSR